MTRYVLKAGVGCVVLALTFAVTEGAGSQLLLNHSGQSASYSSDPVVTDARGVDTAARWAVASALMSAVKARDPARVEALLELDPALVDFRDKAGRTPLHWAARGSSLPVLALLIENGADVNAVDGRGIAAIHCLASSGNLEGIRLLLDGGADPNLVSADGKTALDFAARAGMVKALRLLMARSREFPRGEG